MPMDQEKQPISLKAFSHHTLQQPLTVLLTILYSAQQSMDMYKVKSYKCTQFLCNLVSID